jgi:hypothetical protein
MQIEEFLRVVTVPLFFFLHPGFSTFITQVGYPEDRSGLGGRVGARNLLFAHFDLLSNPF